MVRSNGPSGLAKTRGARVMPPTTGHRHGRHEAPNPKTFDRPLYATRSVRRALSETEDGPRGCVTRAREGRHARCSRTLVAALAAASMAIDLELQLRPCRFATIW
jgi:hypothetical protein